ncbi:MULTISPECIES: GNAT family N-acetyltransferase [unclassified Streptomyces]|uniref:GNAT family N-acetyltransferase n=1 Tax=unclassified Streptomyces TaxID=2593676 RepID=UPI0036E27992
MSFTVEVRRTEELGKTGRSELRAMLQESFPRYSQTSWEHCLGGLHYLLRYRGELVCHGALVQRYFRQGTRELNGVYGESMATIPKLRHRGLGSVVVAMATAEIRLHYDIGVFAASKYAFYERQGWQKWRGPTFVDDGPVTRPKAPDRGAVMFRLPANSTIDPDADLTTDMRSGDIW